MRTALVILVLIAVIAGPALAAPKRYGPGYGLGGAPDLGQVRTKQQLLARYIAHGGQQWVKARLTEAIRLEPTIRTIVFRAKQKHGITADQFVADAADVVDRFVRGGKVSHERYAEGQILLVVSSSLGASTNRAFVYDSAKSQQARLADHWQFWVTVYGVDMRLSVIQYCGNLAVMTVRPTATPTALASPAVPTPTPVPTITFRPIPELTPIPISFEGRRHGMSAGQQGLIAPVPNPNVFVPQTKVTVYGSSASSVSGAATGGTATAINPALTGRVTVGSATANAAATTSVSGAAAATGGAGAGPIATAVQGSDASGGNATTPPVTITFGN
jgi:hypothetical protein